VTETSHNPFIHNFIEISDPAKDKSHGRLLMLCLDVLEDHNKIVNMEISIKTRAVIEAYRGDETADECVK
jgi:hypothetical protein